MDYTVHVVTKSRAQLSHFHFTSLCIQNYYNNPNSVYFFLGHVTFLDLGWEGRRGCFCLHNSLSS